MNAADAVSVDAEPHEGAASVRFHGIWPILMLGALALGLALFETRELPLIDRDEGRYAEGAREMLASGDWLVPRLFGVPYLEKPPLFFWMTAASCGLVGVDELGARLVSALAAAVGVVVTGLFARRAFGRRAGVLAAAVLATSGLYLVLARVVITDMLFSVLVTGALVSWFLAETEKRSFLPFWLLAAAATLTKGPVAAVLCGLVGLGYLASERSLGDLRSLRFWIGMPVFLAIVLSWFALVEIRYPGFVYFYVYKEHLLRVAGDEHREPFFWYLPWVLAGWLPWTPIAVALAPAIGRRLSEQTARGRAARFVAIWACVVLVFFSIARGKLVPYILPMFPAMAILLGDALDDWLEDRAASAAVSRSVYAIAACLLLAVLAVPYAVWASPATVPPHLVALVPSALLAAAAVLLALARSHSLRPIAAVAASVAALECVVVLVASPIQRQLTTWPVVDILQKELRPDDEVVLYSGYFPNVPFYLQRIPLFVEGNRELDFGVSLEGSGPAIVKNIAELERRVGRRRLLLVLRTRERDLQRLSRMPGTRLLYKGRSSSLVERRP
ncbi:MAG: glycosyltransferase family 39 protein [Candidatus Binatia bacterium]